MYVFEENRRDVELYGRCDELKDANQDDWCIFIEVLE